MKFIWIVSNELISRNSFKSKIVAIKDSLSPKKYFVKSSFYLFLWRKRCYHESFAQKCVRVNSMSDITTAQCGNCCDLVSHILVKVTFLLSKEISKELFWRNISLVRLNFSFYHTVRVHIRVMWKTEKFT